MSRVSEQLLICPTCGGNAYVIVERDDWDKSSGTLRHCAANCLTDEHAACWFVRYLVKNHAAGRSP